RPPRSHRPRGLDRAPLRPSYGLVFKRVGRFHRYRPISRRRRLGRDDRPGRLGHPRRAVLEHNVVATQVAGFNPITNGWFWVIGDTRAAAFETGAIEGLYPTTRGITRMVALQGAMWEAELEKLGPDAAAGVF
ncbi:MAG TPA: hypothetical protein VND96_05870, partial [Candidatus Micrarchaeaceae archaeon]|nr:hypothetical protein [Candidatus Micrarchaeaceae archaeon]